MSEQLPSLESLNEAVKAIWPMRGWHDASLCVGFPTMKPAFIAHAHTLDQLHGRKPVDPIEEAIEAAWDEWKASYYDGQMGLKQTDFKAACRKHFAGLTFPKGDAA